MTRLGITIAGLCATCAQSAVADLNVRFQEGAPKDRFVITYTGVCDVGPITLSVDLNGSAGGLVYDVTEAGAGVAVFQPFELVQGAAFVTDLPDVSDGDRVLSLGLDGLVQDSVVAFTIDLDDTISLRGTTVSGAEIAGALARVSGVGATPVDGVFGASSQANVPINPCVS